MDQLLQMLGDHFVMALIAFVFLVGMLLKAATTLITSFAQERSRREIAAYIAEGSITPEHGERLLKADVGDAKKGAC